MQDELKEVSVSVEFLTTCHDDYAHQELNEYHICVRSSRDLRQTIAMVINVIKLIVIRDLYEFP